MEKKRTIKKLSLMLVFLFSFVFQTAYSLAFNVPAVYGTDYWHKHLTKSSPKEETSGNSFIEKEIEKEKDSEFDYELLVFFLPRLIYQLECINSNDFTSIEKKTPHFNKESIFIIVRSIRI